MSNAKKPLSKPTEIAPKIVTGMADNATQVAETAFTAANNTAQSAANATQSAISSISSKVATPDQMLHAGSEAVRNFLSAGTEEAQKTHEKVLSIGRESVDKWSETADKTARSMSEVIAIGKDHVDALMESSKIATDLGRDLQGNFISEVNALFAENVELSKELLACRTLNDLVEIQNRAVQTNLSRFFNHSARLTEAWFKLATDATDPLNAQVTQVANRLNKTINS